MQKINIWEKLLCVLMAFSIIFTVIIPISPNVAYAADKDEYDGLREKYKIKLTGYDPDKPYELNPDKPYEPKDEYIKLSIDSLDSKVYKHLSTMNSDCVWDNAVEPVPKDPEKLHAIIGRLNILAMGWATPGSAYYNDADLLNKIIKGMDWLYANRYNENTAQYGNWYAWEIDIPLDFNNTVVLLYDHLTSAQINNYMTAVDHFSPEVYYRPGSTNILTGANRILKCMVVGIRAIIVKDSGKLQESSDGMEDVFKYTTGGDGFYTDGSFIQHKYYPYAGAYGKDLLVNISEMLWLLSGSRWESNSQYKGNVYKWIFDTYEPALFKGELFSSVRDRDIARQLSGSTLIGFGIINSILTLSEMSTNTHSSEYKSMVKYHLQSDFLDCYFRTCGNWYVQKAKDILNDASVTPRAELTGNYQFYNQDRIVQRGQGWAFDIAMHSTRIRNYECINKENLKGWYTGDGMTYLYTSPADYALNFWPTVDPHRLPGITADRYTSRNDSPVAGKINLHTWVGGVSLGGLYGTAGMDFRQHDSGVTPEMDLSAKKSWFMFDDEVVSLGAGISSTSGRTIETVVDNRLLNSQGNNPLTVNGTTMSSALGWSETMNNVNWIHLDGTGGYVFPGGMTVNGFRNRREGKYLDINKLYYDNEDEFNNTKQGSAWMWIREDGDKHSLTGTALNIATQQGTLEGALNTTENILLANAPRYDLYTETKLAFLPSVLGQEAGLILYKDDDNYVCISRIYTASGKKIAAVSENGGTSAKNYFDDTYGETVYFRIEKCGSDYLLYASSDGQNWGTALHTYTNDMAGTDGNNSSLKMGLFAQNGNNPDTPEITASFDYFRLKLIRNYMTLWKDHGINPVKDTYSYIALPTKTAGEVGSYSSNPDVSILRNDESVQAVKEKTLGIIGANFWSPGSVSYITSYDPAAVMVKDQNNLLEIAVSDPTHTRSRSKVKIELCKPGLSVISKDPTVTVLQMSPTVILEADITGADATKGKTHNITVSYDPLAPTLLPHTMIKLPCLEDAHVMGYTNGDINYGNAKVLLVKNPDKADSTHNREIFLKYDMNSINENIAIESAKLYIFGSVNDTVGTESDISAYGVDNDGWTEGAITYNSRPSAGDVLSSAHISGKNDWYEMDVTSFVKTQYEGDKVVSLSIAMPSKGPSTEILSKENASASYLVLTFASPSKLNDVQAGPAGNTVFADAAAVIAALPTSVTAITANGQTVGIPVTDWADMDGFNPNVTGSYTFTATLAVPSGYADAGNYTTTVEVVVGTDAAPALQSAVAGDGHVKITWSEVAGSTGYEVYASTVSNSYSVPVTTVAGLVYDYDVTGLTNGTTYYFAVKAVNQGGSSDYSNELSATPHALPISNEIVVDLPVEEDSTVKAGDFLDNNYGSDITLEVQKSDNANNNMRAYLKFDLSPIEGQILSAKLYVRGRATEGTEIDNKLYSADDDSWTESGITWNNKPDQSQYLSTIHMTNSPSEWEECDVTSYIQAQCAGDKKASFVILQDVSGEGLYTVYRSKEKSGGGSYLKVTYQETSAAIEITSFDTIADISAGPAGSTSYADAAAVKAALPTSVKANGNTVDVPVTIWTDTDGYDPNVAGSYTFTATLGAIPSGYANTGNHTATVEVVVGTVAAPVMQSAVAGDGHVNITWSEVAGSTGYVIYASTVSNSYSVPVTTVAGLVYDYDVTGLTNGTTYYFAVKAVNQGGSSDYSNELSATPHALPISNEIVVDLPVEEDSTVKAGDFLDNNYGSDITLEVQKSDNANNNMRAYLKFDLSPIEGQILSAKLYVRGRATEGTEIDNKLYSADDDSWTESGITWNNKPDQSQYLSTIHMTNSPSEWEECDVTSYIQAQCAGDKKASFVILQDVSGEGLYTVYRSKEKSDGGSYLKVTYLEADAAIEITSFDAIADISVGAAGSAIYADAAAVTAALPDSVRANGNTVEVPVTTWVDTDGYNPNVAGSYTFTATLGAIPPGYANTGNHTATVEVVVETVAAPVIQSAVAGDGHVNITWSAVPGSTGYEVYASMVPNSYTEPAATVAGTVYDYDITGLTNGTTYYFAVKAINAGGDSPHSAEVSATPRTVPGAPVNVMAAAGDGQATVSFAAPSDNGGSPVTEYIVTSNPGAITARGAGTSIIVAGLSNGTNYTFTVRAVNAAGSSMESAASNTVTPYAPSSEDDEDDSEDDSTPSANMPVQEQTIPAEDGIGVFVNGNAVTMATATTTVIEDRTVTTISIDDKKVEEILQNQGDNALLTLSVKNGADAIVSRLNAQTVRRMEAAGAVLEIRTENVIYTLPAAHISIDNVLSQFGEQVELEDITVNINVSEPPDNIIKIIEDTADKNNYQIVVKPVEFEITCTSGDKTVNISKFNGYIERMVAIPEGVDPGKITTGVVLNPDGTFSHVPTVITVIDGKYYAKISSMTNSTYSVIWNLKSFKDVETHWAKDAVNDMGSRLIINGVSEEIFEPERDISRAEFATIISKALGLMKPGAGKDVFGDVAKDAWYYDAVSAAYEYGIIAGYGNGKFEPDCEITREQAMVMITRAMKIANLKVEFDDGEEDKLLENYIDADKSADYAKSSIAACIKAGIVIGRNGNLVAPKDFITRAEAAIIVRRLLQKSNLI